MKECATAFELMGKNREAAHIFDLGGDWSVVFVMVNQAKSAELSEVLRQWFAQTYGGELSQWPVIDSVKHQQKEGSS